LGRKICLRRAVASEIWISGILKVLMFDILEHGGVSVGLMTTSTTFGALVNAL
jgi:hypothetical protein